MQAVLVIDRSGRISLANPAAERATGYTRAELEQLTAAHVISGGSLVTKSAARLPVSVTTATMAGDRGSVVVLSDEQGSHQQVAERIANDARHLMASPEHARPLDLHRVVEEAVAMLHRAGNLLRIEVVLALDGQPLLVTLGKARLERVLAELLVNAADATPGPGKIMLAVRRDEHRRHAVVEIIDTGTGIAPTVLPKIFDPFFTTKIHGTGLGLTIVRAIVERSGGAVAVETSLGIGSTFTFEIPMTASR